MKDNVGRPYEMVRGLCPRDCIRWAVEGGGRTVGGAGAIGHATRLQQTHPGNPANAGRRGRRPLRAVCILHVAAYNVRAQPAHHLYVAATASVIPRREGVEACPYGGLGRFTGNVVATYQRRPQPLSHGALRRDGSPCRGAESET